MEVICGFLKRKDNALNIISSSGIHTSLNEDMLNIQPHLIVQRQEWILVFSCSVSLHTFLVADLKCSTVNYFVFHLVDLYSPPTAYVFESKLKMNHLGNVYLDVNCSSRQSPMNMAFGYKNNCIILATAHGFLTNLLCFVQRANRRSTKILQTYM